MGQQQLLLIILVVIVVGIATIIATNVISIGAELSNRDAIKQDLMTATSSLHPIWERPVVMGGAGKDFQANITDERITELIQLAGTVEGNVITNANAVYTITSTGPNSILIEAEPRTGGDEISITINKNEDDLWIYTLVDGDQTITNEVNSG